MNWKKIRTWVIVIAIANVIVYFINTLIQAALSPSCVEDIVNSSKSNSAIMKKIGGYSGFSSSAEVQKYMDGEPAGFELTILGESSIVIFTGIVHRNGNNCQLTKIDTIYSEY